MKVITQNQMKLIFHLFSFWGSDTLSLKIKKKGSGEFPIAAARPADKRILILVPNMKPDRRISKRVPQFSFSAWDILA